MKTLATLNKNDLRIIADALSTVIVRKTEVKLLPPLDIHTKPEVFHECLDEMANHLYHNANMIAQIGEILKVITEAINQSIPE